MISSRHIALLRPLLAVALFLASPNGAWAGDGPKSNVGPEPTWRVAATGQGLAVQLTQKKKLKLKRMKVSDGVKRAYLDGVLVVQLTNLSDQKLVLEEFDVHNLVFVDVKDATNYILLHSCACVAQCETDGPAAASSRKALTLMPGEAKTLIFEDFGCSGSMYVPPGPGTYDLYYRVRPYPAEPLKLACPEPMKVQETIESCRTLLQSAGFWMGAWTGIPLRIKLK